LEAQCLKRQGVPLRGLTETIGERLERGGDRMVLSPLPDSLYDACEKVATRVNS
jgi:hypothetical protein